MALCNDSADCGIVDLKLSGVKTYIYTLFLSITVGLSGLRAQDLHYSQFYLSTLNLNPSMSGIFPGDVRIGTQMRSQWYVNNLSQYRTFTAQGAYKTGIRPYKPHFFTLGVVFNYDYAGDSKLSLTHLGLSGSYSHILNPSNIISSDLYRYRSGIQLRVAKELSPKSTRRHWRIAPQPPTSEF